MEKETRTGLGDLFDRAVRALDGAPDVISTRPSTIRARTFLETSQTFILQTYRRKDDGDHIMLEYVGAEGSFRIPLPPIVAATIARQRDALSDQSRSNAGKARAANDKARGIAPGFARAPFADETTDEDKATLSGDTVTLGKHPATRFSMPLCERCHGAGWVGENPRVPCPDCGSVTVSFPVVRPADGISPIPIDKISETPIGKANKKSWDAATPKRKRRNKK